MDFFGYLGPGLRFGEKKIMLVFRGFSGQIKKKRSTRNTCFVCRKAVIQSHWVRRLGEILGVVPFFMDFFVYLGPRQERAEVRREKDYVSVPRFFRTN